MSQLPYGSAFVSPDVARQRDEQKQRIEDQVRQVQAKSEAYEEFGRRVEDLRAVGVSKDGGAEVTLDVHGAMVDLALTDKVSDATLVQIRQDVLEANDAARVELARLVRELAEDVGGVDSETSASLDALYRPRLDEDDDDDSDDGDGTNRRRDGGVLR
ncbi:hypothetical protein ACPYO6_07215 [Georgenia sp. Z1344]|uniref:hypothetical protein n=1 Tax=Georgenia sp. Z1344 TaxID=3416706 RepID=UPI003CF3C752